MTPRFLEVAFRNKILILLPIALGLFAGIALVSLDDSETYVSQATVWVERPTDFSGGSFIEYNQFATPAQNQAAGMRELLTTKSFVTGVLDRVDGPAGPAGHPDSRYREIRRSTSIVDSGTHVLFVRYSADIPMEATDTITAIVEEYADLYRIQVQQRAERANEFYAEELAEARDALEVGTAELLQYVSERPELLEIDLTDPPATALRDLDFARLVVSEQNARAHYESVLTNYTESQITAQAATDTNPNFAVLDQPEVPTAPLASTRRALLIQPIAGLLFGSFVAAGIWFARWRLDRAIRLPSDLGFLSPTIPLAILPSLRARRRRWPRTFVRLAAGLRSQMKTLEPPPLARGKAGRG